MRNDALIASLNHDFALAIIDVQMPGMDGYELAELLRGQEATRNLPIIFLSAVYHEDYYVFRGYEAGAVDFIIKPYHPRILLGKATVFLKLAGQRMESRRMAAELRLANEALETRVLERTELAEVRAKQLQSLAVELIEAEERERRRVAEILHDDLQQLLAAARFQLMAARQSLPPAPELESVELLLDESIGKSRRLSHELSPAVLHHSGLVAALNWLSGQMEKQFGLKVRLEVDEARSFESPLKLFLFRAAQELLFNVVKHAKVKSARVVLFKSDSFIGITVSDEGEGFNPAMLDCPTITTGFGLLRLRERVRYIGGNLAVESAPGQGSCFTFTVPLQIENADNPQRNEPPSAREPRAPARYMDTAGSSGGARVLFVDDHQVMRQGLIRLIESQPDIHVVGEAANGWEALEQVRQLKPDVVVMDIAMPKMDGIEATRRIKAELPEARIIGLSMFDDEPISQAMRESGAEGCVSKTVSSAELLKAIYGIAPGDRIEQ